MAEIDRVPAAVLFWRYLFPGKLAKPLAEKNMKVIFCFLIMILLLLPLVSNADEICEGQKSIETYLKYHFWFLGFTKYNKECSQITVGDFNNDGKHDYAAVLTEVQPFEKYANGKDWYRTYIMVLLAGDLPYNQYQAIFVRTDGNKPKGVSVYAVKSQESYDLVVELERYSSTKYRWDKYGFKIIEHSAD